MWPEESRKPWPLPAPVEGTLRRRLGGWEEGRVVPGRRNGIRGGPEAGWGLGVGGGGGWWLEDSRQGGTVEQEGILEATEA